MSIFRVFCYVFIFFPFWSLAQNTTNYQNLKNISVKSADINKLFFYCRKANNALQKEDLDAFQKGILLTTANDTFAIHARLLSSKDDIQILIGDAPCVLFKQKTKAIAIGNQVFIQSDYPDNDQLFNSYFELVSEGPVLLLKKENNSFYYKKADQPARKIKRNKKALSKVFPSAKNLISKNKLNLKKEEDLVRLFEHINSNIILAMQ